MGGDTVYHSQRKTQTPISMESLTKSNIDLIFDDF